MPAEKSVRELARELVERLDMVHNDLRYKSVWMVSQLHVGLYTGPTYKAELDALRAALADDAPGEMVMVPREPTQAMLTAVGIYTEGAISDEHAREIYLAMLAAKDAK